MKNIIVLIASTMLASTAYAGTIETSVGTAFQGNSVDSFFAEAKVSGEVSSMLDVDVTGRYTVNGDISGNRFVKNSDSVRTEVGLTAHTGPVYLRGATGVNFLDKSNDFLYYSVEGGLRGNVGPVALQVGARYRDAYDQSFDFKTYSGVVRAAYNVTDSVTVGVGYVKSFGDINDNEVSGVVNVKF